MSDSLCPRELKHTRLPCPSQCPGFSQTHVHWVSDIIPLSHPLSPPFPSIRAFSDELELHIRWPKHCSFSFSISPSNKYLGLIFFKIDWFDLFAVQGTLKSLPQHHSSKASVLWCSTFFIVQFSHPYTTSGKAIALTIWMFVSKVMSWLFSTLSSYVIAFLSRRKRLGFSHSAQCFCSPRR